MRIRLNWPGRLHFSWSLWSLILNLMSRAIGQRKSAVVTMLMIIRKMVGKRAARRKSNDTQSEIGNIRRDRIDPRSITVPVAIQCKIDELFYGDFMAVRDSDVTIEKNSITAFIGPSGCGKSTVLRCINRMNDLIRSFGLRARLLFHGIDIYARNRSGRACAAISGWCFSSPIRFP